MAKRKRASNALLGFLIVIGLAVWLIKSSFEALSSALPVNFSWPAIIAVLVTAASALIVIQGYINRRRARLLAAAQREAIRQRGAALLTKYRDPTIAHEIIAGSIWHDMTKEQLLDAWGHPDDIETKVMKTKIREIYKFGRVGINRFQRRVTLENDIVVGWEQK